MLIHYIEIQIIGISHGFNAAAAAAATTGEYLDTGD